MERRRTLFAAAARVALSCAWTSRLPRFGPLDPAGEAFSGVCDLPQRFPFKFFRRLSVSPNLHRATIEEGTTLNGKRLVVNIANDMCLRFQKTSPP